MRSRRFFSRDRLAVLRPIARPGDWCILIGSRLSVGMCRVPVFCNRRQGCHRQALPRLAGFVPALNRFALQRRRWRIGSASRISRPMTGRTRMLYRGSIGAIRLALAPPAASAAAQAFDESRYPAEVIGSSVE
jgi:hypothetical protein